jgi:hypothetical protein
MSSADEIRFLPCSTCFSGGASERRGQLSERFCAKAKRSARAEHALGKGEKIARFEEIGPDERRDPYHFGASLARLIASYPGQEVGTHTFLHRCALEPAETVARFSAVQAP